MLLVNYAIFTFMWIFNSSLSPHQVGKGEQEVLKVKEVNVKQNL